MPGEGADGRLVPAVTDVGEILEPADVDEHGRQGQPKLHQREQGVPTGEQLGVVAVLGEQAERLVRGPARA